jgi:hypothetical protein
MSIVIVIQFLRMAANSRERRQLKRLLLRLGLPPKEGVPSLPKPPQPQPLWKSISKKVYAALTLLGLFVTFFVLWPWLSLDKSGSLDPSNALKTLFFATNEGFLPLTDLTVTCLVTARANSRGITINAPPVTQHPSHFLTYKKKTNLFCERAIFTGPVDWDSISMHISINYGVLYLPIHVPQTFSVEGEKSADGTWQWLFRD